MAKAKAVKFEEKGNQVITTVEVPAHTVEVVVAESVIPGCAMAAVTAWEKVKGDDDASFDAMDGSFRSNLIHTAEAVYNTGAVQKGDGTLARFEQEVATAKGAQDEAKAKADAKAAKKAA